MKLAALVGFLTGTLLVLWGFLRQHSTAADPDPDPLDEVQWDPHLLTVTRTFGIDCE